MLPELVLADLFMAVIRNKTQSFPTVWFRRDIWKQCFATSDYVPNFSAKLSIKGLVIVLLSFWENSMDYLDPIKL